MTTADGTAAPAEEQPDDCDEPALIHVVRDSDTRADPGHGSPFSPRALSEPRGALAPGHVRHGRASRRATATVACTDAPPRPPTAHRSWPSSRPETRQQKSFRPGRSSRHSRSAVRSFSSPARERSSPYRRARVHSTRSGRITSYPRRTNRRRAHTTVPTAATHASLVSTTSSAVTYSVPASSYSIVITITHPCWLVVHSPASSSKTLVAKTIEPALSPLTVPVHGSASITIAARAASLSIVSGSTVLDTVDNPRLGVAYTFVPATS